VKRLRGGIWACATEKLDVVTGFSCFQFTICVGGVETWSGGLGVGSAGSALLED